MLKIVLRYGMYGVIMIMNVMKMRVNHSLSNTRISWVR